jgi:hypothetical protein
MLREMYFYFFPVNMVGNLAISNLLDMNPIQEFFRKSLCIIHMVTKFVITLNLLKV